MMPAAPSNNLDLGTGNEAHHSCKTSYANFKNIISSELIILEIQISQALTLL